MKLFFTLLIFFYSLGGYSQSQKEKLAYQYYSGKQYEKAVTLYADLHKSSPEKRFYGPLLKSYLFLERYKEAQKLVKVHIKKNPERIEFNIDLGHIYEAEKKETKATQAYDNTIKLMISNVNSILAVGNRFYQKGKYDYAIKAYKKGAKLLNGDYPFSFELAKVYEAKGDLTNMSKVLIGIIHYSNEYLESVKSALSTLFYEDTSKKKKSIFKDELLTQVQKNPSKTALTELLIWFFLQEKKFNSALIHSKALDKRNKEAGDRIAKLAKTCIQNKEYEIAVKAYNYLLKKDKGSYFYRIARTKLVEVLNIKITEDPQSSNEDILSLKQNYEDALDELGRNAYTIDLIAGYAQLLAFKLNQTEKAKQQLESALNITRAQPQKIANCKLILGDIYVKENEVWEAALLYGQVNHDFKEDIIGHKAKLRTAKAYFYTGEFEWAKSQLDVLKASTTKLIANNALQLSVLISDNLGMDTSTAALKIYALADLYKFQNNDSLAILACDNVIDSFPENITLLDDAYFMKAKIYTQNKKWNLALKSYQRAVDYNDLLKDDALFEMGIIYKNILNSPDKAIECFEEIVLEHQDSFYSVEARKNYRTLRGDFGNRQ